MELKEKLTRFRRERELSQTELAQSLGVTRQAVSGWERGTAVPSAEKLIALSRLYGVPLDELVNGAEPPGEELGAEAAEPEPAPPEAEEAPRRAALSWRVAAAALAGCILFAGITLGAALGFTLSKCPETPKDGLTIISQDDVEWEDIDLTEVIDMTDRTTNIVP